ncbi:hypothetical protein CJU90_4766 [Yarrowia sp. C11]|nr:hypothetical protein CJU90_4766 [Yarrowia sp. C11]KAG5364586.1 hypothetical protein CKK34_3398 [Yarrowia sp. E02]
MKFLIVLFCLVCLAVAQQNRPQNLPQQQGVRVSVRPAQARGDTYLSKKNNLIVSQKTQKNPAQLMITRGLLVDTKSQLQAHLGKDNSLSFSKNVGTVGFNVDPRGQVNFQHAGFVACEDGNGVYQIKPDIAGTRKDCKNPQHVVISALN